MPGQALAIRGLRWLNELIVRHLPNWPARIPVQFLQADLKSVLLSPAWQLTVLAIVGTAALEMLVAVWAAASRWHWFLRALAVWGAVAALVPVRAYQPALLFAISSPLTVASICGWRTIAARRAMVGAEPESPRAVAMRFGLLDLFLLVAIVGLSLVVLIEVVQNLQDIEWGSVAGYVVALVALGLASYAAVFGQKRRLWTYAAAVGAIAAAVFFIWSSSDWLGVGLLLGVDAPLIGGVRGLAEAITLEFTVAYILLLLLLRLCDRENRTVLLQPARLGLAVTTIGLLGLWAPIYWQMLWLTPVAPPPTDRPNHYKRIVAIANDVAASKKDELSLADVRAATPDSDVSDRVKILYDELLTLLEAPNFVVVPPVATMEKEGISGWSSQMDSIQPVRALARSLKAEAKDAVSKGDVGRAVAWNIANIRLGSMFSRGGTTIDYLVGMAVEGTGTAHLAQIRERLGPAQSRMVITALSRALAEHDSPDVVRQRDIAYWERWNGWQGRLETVIANMQGQQPGTEVSSANLRRLTLHRLLQSDLAIRLYRQDEERWPPTLDVLVPEYLPAIPIDSYSGQPLCYRPDDNEFLLYSVGQDRSDNGGRFGNASDYHSGSGYDLDLDLWSRP